ncbi:hypothetical protein JXB12_04745 [candidate division KSB1 bacterium]|nr:hypothetical protein [candidate division KSB1 bacterium]
MKSARNKIACIGQLTWDAYAHYRFIGGSSANVALNCHRLGMESYLVSKIGQDSDGSALLDKLHQVGFNTDYIQIAEDKDTAVVYVSNKQQGEVSYRCSNDVAFDFIEYQPALSSLAERINFVYFDIISQRNSTTRSTIQQFLEATSAQYIVCDINIRNQSGKLRRIIDRSLQHATIVKMNRLELVNLLAIFHYTDVPRDVESLLSFLADKYSIDYIIFSQDIAGFMLFDRQKGLVQFSSPGSSIIDTSGAGDALVSAFIVGLLQNKPLNELGNFCNDFTSRILSRYGPNIIASE